MLGRARKQEAGTARILGSRDVQGWFQPGDKVPSGCAVTSGWEILMGRLPVRDLVWLQPELRRSPGEPRIDAEGEEGGK